MLAISLEAPLEQEPFEDVGEVTVDSVRFDGNMTVTQDQGVAVIPWSPLARGRLARAWDESSARQETDVFGRSLYSDADPQIVDAVGAIAAARANAERAGALGVP